MLARETCHHFIVMTARPDDDYGLDELLRSSVKEKGRKQLPTFHIYHTREAVGVLTLFLPLADQVFSYREC